MQTLNTIKPAWETEIITLYMKQLTFIFRYGLLSCSPENSNMNKETGLKNNLNSIL